MAETTKDTLSYLERDDAKTFQLKLQRDIIACPDRMQCQIMLDTFMVTLMELCAAKLGDEKAPTYIYGALLSYFPNQNEWFPGEGNEEYQASDEDLKEFETIFGDHSSNGKTHGDGNDEDLEVSEDDLSEFEKHFDEDHDGEIH